MAEIIGRNLEVGVATEYTRGTVKAQPEKTIKKITANLFERIEKKVDESQCNVMEGSSDVRIIKKEVSGEIEGNVHADAIGYLLYNLYGADTETSVSGAYSHLFSLAQNIQHPSLSFFIKDGSIYQKSINGCMVDELEITAKSDDFVKFKALITGRDINTNASSFACDTEYDFVGRDVSVKVATTEAGIAGATARKLDEVSIKFSNNNLKEHNLGSYTNADILNSELSIECSLTGVLTDTVIKDYWSANTNLYMEIKIEGEATIGSASKPTITLLLNRVNIMNWEKYGANNELVMESYDVKALYNKTDGEASTLTLINLTAEYDTPTSV